MMAHLFLLAMAAMLFAVGTWGRNNAHDLVPGSLSPSARARKERVLRRGALSCRVLAVMFVVLVTLAVVTGERPGDPVTSSDENSDISAEPVVG